MSIGAFGPLHRPAQSMRGDARSRRMALTSATAKLLTLFTTPEPLTIGHCADKSAIEGVVARDDVAPVGRGGRTAETRAGANTAGNVSAGWHTLQPSV